MKKLLPFALLFLVAGCRVKGTLPPGVGAKPDPLPPPISVPPVEATPATQPSSLQWSASSDRKTLRRGQTLRLEMRLLNAGKEKQLARYTSGQDFDLQVRRAGEKETAWTWSMDKMFTDALRDITLRPGESQKFSATWDGTSGGTRLPRGNYIITAISSSQPAPKAALIPITIE